MLLLGLLSVSTAVFASSYAGNAPLYTLEYTVFPFLIWAAIRFGIAGAAMANVLASAIAVWGTVHGWGRTASARSASGSCSCKSSWGSWRAPGSCSAPPCRSATPRRAGVASSTRSRRCWRRPPTRPPRCCGFCEVIGAQMEWEVGLFWSLDRQSQHLRCANVWRQPPALASEFERISRGRSFGLGRRAAGSRVGQRRAVVAD